MESFVDGFLPKDIFNADECGLFFKALPNRSLAIKGDMCKSGKQSKVRVSIMLGASATGEKLRPFVIGKSLKPRCFKNIKLKDLPVTYAANKKAWMLSKLFESWVASLNEDMKEQDRSILLIVDNCPAHPKMHGLSNVTLKFLPPNTTSEVQPMDRGIIKNFKMFYRKLLLRMVVSKSDLGQSASILAKSVSVLDVIKWIDEAWKSVTETTIKNCFRKAGFDFTEQSQGAETEETEIDVRCPNEIDGVPFDFDEFVGCDDNVAITQTSDDRELREAVLDGADIDDYEEEDLIPLADLRRKMAIGFEQPTDSASPIGLGSGRIQSDPVIDQLQVSKMLDDVLRFARESFPEMIGYLESCQKLLVERLG